jgi:coenzyme PQQ biosynthesis protein PqqD
VIVGSQNRPVLAKGCRLKKNNSKSRAEVATVLLVPEGVIELSQSAAKILEMCDGLKTVSDIIRALQSDYRPSSREAICVDINNFFESLRIRRVIDLP